MVRLSLELEADNVQYKNGKNGIKSIFKNWMIAYITFMIVTIIIISWRAFLIFTSYG